ncbi:MAG: hypothetical protein D6B27_07915 [Gammaproteobacteria bacterium]|nr:MAG: hypothetical protein D6B27_07915 [Gammaproteobacteria bacterium]
MVDICKFRIPGVLIRVPLLLAIIAVILYLVLIPFYGEYPDTAKTAEMIQSTETLRTLVAKHIKNKKSLSEIDTAPYIDQNKYLSHIFLSKSGEMVLFGESFGVMLIFTPVYENNDLEWRCEGAPSEKVPYSCQNKTTLIKRKVNYYCSL